MVKGKHPAAITEEEFYKIANKFKMRDFYKEYSPSEIADALPLRHILLCGCCGKTLSGSTTSGHGGLYFYYYCINKKCPFYRNGSTSNKKIHDEVEKFLGMLTLDEDYMDGFKIIVDAIRKEKGAVKEKQIELIKNKINEIECEIDRTVTKLTEAQSEIVYKVLEEKITKLDEERKQLKGEILSFQSGSINDFMDEFDGLKTIIQCPLNIRKGADMELKRLLIANIFNGGLSYSRDKGVQTSKMPVVYAQKSNIREKINSFKKMGVQTQISLDENWIKKNKSCILG